MFISEQELQKLKDLHYKVETLSKKVYELENRIDKAEIDQIDYPLISFGADPMKRISRVKTFYDKVNALYEYLRLETKELSEVPAKTIAVKKKKS